jgi:hypothetical protein
MGRFAGVYTYEQSEDCHMGREGLLERRTAHYNGVLCLFTIRFASICHEDYDDSPFLSPRLQGSGACFGSLGQGWIDSAFGAT